QIRRPGAMRRCARSRWPAPAAAGGTSCPCWPPGEWRPGWPRSPPAPAPATSRQQRCRRPARPCPPPTLSYPVPARTEVMPARRAGSYQLVAADSLGRAGIVLGLESSRLARDSADWQQVVKICAHADTLICDEDGLYDPAIFNDRVLLGMKGQLSEFELHFL